MKEQRRWIELATVIVGAVLSTLFFWVLAYALAPDREAFLADRSWRYQLGWMPVHLLLGYFSILIYKKAAHGMHYGEITWRSIQDDIRRNQRAVLFAVLLVTPFVIEDLIEGVGQFNAQRDTLGWATWVLIGPVWIIEWLMLGVIWSRVIALLSLTVRTFNPDYVRKHLDTLLVSSRSIPLLRAGVENALVNFFYALTTIGYILYTGGEASDFQTVIISGLLVLLSFLFTCWFLRMRVESVLETMAVEHAKKIDQAYPMGEHASLQERFQHYRLNASLIDQFVLHRPEKINRRGLERLALVRTSLLLESIQQNSSAEFLDVPTGLKALRYTQYERKLSSLGLAELRGVLIRLGSPLLMLFLKLPMLMQWFK